MPDDRPCGARDAFTLIELLVVIAVIALLLGLLLPALSGARDSVRVVVCQSRQRSLAQAQNVYMFDHREYYACRNTTGLIDPLEYHVSYITGADGTSTTPVQAWDWISPILGEEMNFSTNRARRWAGIYNDLHDPASVVYNDTLFNRTPDARDFEEILASVGIRQASYMQPSAFVYYPDTRTARAVADRTMVHTRWGPRRAPVIGFPFEREFRVPANFHPRLDLVAIQPSAKIAVADATRYYDPPRGLVDFDIEAFPQFFGGFSCSEPSYDGSAEFGRGFGARQGRPGDESNLDLTARHPGRTMNVGRFDGSVASIRLQEAWRDPAPWWPSRSEYTGVGDPTPEVASRFEPGDRLP